MSGTYQPGELVAVRGRIVEDARGGGGEEYRVEFFSKTTQYVELIRGEDIIERIAEPDPECNDLDIVADANGQLYQWLAAHQRWMNMTTRQWADPHCPRRPLKRIATAGVLCVEVDG